MDGWKTSFLFGWPIFRCYVSFREGIHPQKTRVFFCRCSYCRNWSETQGFRDEIGRRWKFGCWGDLSRMVAGRSDFFFVIFTEIPLKYNLVEVSYTVFVPIYPGVWWFERLCDGNRRFSIVLHVLEFFLANLSYIILFGRVCILLFSFWSLLQASHIVIVIVVSIGYQFYWDFSYIAYTIHKLMKYSCKVRRSFTTCPLLQYNTYINYLYCI